MSESRFFSIPEAARLTGVSRTTLWNWVKSGHVKALVTPGGHHRIPNEEVDKILTENRPKDNHYKNSPVVLIVDDDEQMLKILKTGLMRLGFSVETAADGFTAGIKVVELVPDFVILDLFLPGMDGFEVCRKIREKIELAGIRIIAMSGNDSAENIQRILGLGADSFFSKASDARMLLDEIVRLNGSY